MDCFDTDKGRVNAFISIYTFDVHINCQSLGNPCTPTVKVAIYSRKYCLLATVLYNVTVSAIIDYE